MGAREGVYGSTLGAKERDNVVRWAKVSLNRTLLDNLILVQRRSCIALSALWGSGNSKDNVVRRAKVSLNMIWFDGVDLVVALEIFVSIKLVTIVKSKSNT